MKVFVVMTVGRQIEGDMLSIKFEKGFFQASKADEFVKSLAKNYTESITTPSGMVQFVCERGVHEVEIEGDIISQ